ncbi:MAG: DMT family transporter [Porticoccaceae bacterium]|jgi:drug/metabolite transporter (DMT)-like permease|nr:DMT family transporter [Porticoccaceae bacterium]MDC0640550.1 DMT family transporter [Porticoccaceae bacterium]MDG1486309.1 DMT family transporter [Porticoccaceae bacterium]
MSLKTDLRADLILLLTAFIWGLAFVYQRSGMDHIGPVTFTFGRFLIGALAILPLWYVMEKPKQIFAFNKVNRNAALLGLVLTSGMLLQQWGMVYTTAGRAGFLTGVYLVFVPLIGLFFRNKTEWPTWVGMSLALAGLYFMAQIEAEEIFTGDILVLISSLLFALHIIFTGMIANDASPFRLIFVQFTVAAVITGLLVPIFETWDWQGIRDAMVALLYVGVLSSAVGFCLQVVGQRTAPASHTAIILSFESVFAAFCGWWLLDEYLTQTEFIGCGLILAGGLVSQLKVLLKQSSGEPIQHPHGVN